jgi:peptide/nickel transport system permease protein
VRDPGALRMITYTIRRLLQALFVLFLLSILIFLLVRFEFGPPPCPNIQCTQVFNLDQPITTQYVSWIWQVLHANFGISEATGQPELLRLQQALPPTIILIAVSLIVQQIIAIPLGILAAVRQYSRFDLALTFLSYAALSIPSFVVGLVLLNVIGFQLGWFPIARSEDVSIPTLLSNDWWSALLQDPGYILGDLARHLFLPVLVLTFLGVANDSRIVRAAMLQVMHQDYIRTANAKGARRRAVIFKHAFRNALLPIVTNIGLYLPTLIGGVVVVETVFQWGGVGQQFATIAPQAALAGGFGLPTDTGFLEAALLLSAVTVLLVNLITDLLYAWLDPRIRLGETEGG